MTATITQTIPAERTLPGIAIQRVNIFDKDGRFSHQGRIYATEKQARAWAKLQSTHETDAEFAQLIEDLRCEVTTQVEQPAPAVEPEPAPAVAPAATIEDRIRAAYRQLAGEPGAWVSITRIRPHLSDWTRAEQDHALTMINRCPDANIVPESNQKILTDQDRAAAVTIGDQAKHLLWIAA